MTNENGGRRYALESKIQQIDELKRLLYSVDQLDPAELPYAKLEALYHIAIALVQLQPEAKS